MEVLHKTKLTSSEIAILWNTYMMDTMSICILKHFLATVEDIDIKPIIELTIRIANDHIKDIKEIFQTEKIPIPNGFGENEVNLSAPRLYSDTMYLRYLEHMGRTGLGTYALSKAISSRKDIREIIKKWYKQTEEMFDMVVDTSQEKGLYVRNPYMAYPTKVEYVDDDKFLGGIIGLGNKRPLLAVEIAHLGTNIEVGNVGKTIILGFSQVTQCKELRDYFKRGYEIGKKHVEVFLNILKENDTSYPSTWDSTIAETTSAPFSDRIMLFQTGAMNAIAISDYGTGISQSLRKDLGIDYARLIAEMVQYSLEGSKLLIKKGWMEKPPQTIDREKLKNIKH